MIYEIKEGKEVNLVVADSAQEAYEKYSFKAGRIPATKDVENGTLLERRLSRANELNGKRSLIELWPDWFEDSRIKLRPVSSKEMSVRMGR